MHWCWSAYRWATCFLIGISSGTSEYLTKYNILYIFIIFRNHTNTMKEAFDRLLDEIIDSTNALMLKNVPKIALPSVSVILNFRRQDKNSFQAWKNSLTGFNFLLRKKSALVSLENDLVYLYAPVDFADLNVRKLLLFITLVLSGYLKLL